MRAARALKADRVPGRAGDQPTLEARRGHECLVSALYSAAAREGKGAQRVLPSPTRTVSRRVRSDPDLFPELPFR